MRIKLVRLGHSARVVETEDGALLSEVLSTAEVPSQGHSISVNGLGAGGSTALGDGDVVTLVPKIEGGC